jgi:hypothetical protein
MSLKMSCQIFQLTIQTEFVTITKINKIKNLNMFFVKALTRSSTYSPKAQREDGWCESSGRGVIPAIKTFVGIYGSSLRAVN